MEQICFECRHVVELDERGLAKCPNCGAIVAPRASAAAAAPVPSPPPPCSPAESAPPSNAVSAIAPPSSPPPYSEPAVPTTRPASTAALVLGLLFFVPFVTQIAALIFGLVAVFRPRRENERVAAAWIGMILSCVALVAWMGLVPLGLGSVRSVAVFRQFGPPAPAAYEDESDRTEQLALEMGQTHAAARTYRRDFGTWPASMAELRTHSLRAGYVLPKELTYRPVPEPNPKMLDWLLLVSTDLRFDQEGKRLGRPHRLVLRLSGVIQLLESELVQAELDTDSTGSAPRTDTPIAPPPP